MDGFAKLAVFEGVPQAAFAAFGAALRSALDALIAISAQFAAESVSAAAAFGEGAGKALAFIGNAVDSFGKLADMGRLSQGAVNAFSYNIVLVVSQLQQLARVFSVEALDAVGLFSAAVGRDRGTVYLRHPAIRDRDYRSASSRRRRAHHLEGL